MVHTHHVDPDSKCAKHHGQVKWRVTWGSTVSPVLQRHLQVLSGAVMTGVQTVHVYEVFLRAQY